MQSVTLEWSPSFNVGKAHGLDSLEFHAAFPNVPDVGEKVLMSAYDLSEESSKPEQMGDYFTFNVEHRKYYLEGASKLPETHLALKLDISEIDEPNYESWVCDVLLQVYGWKPIE